MPDAKIRDYQRTQITDALDQAEPSPIQCVEPPENGFYARRLDVDGIRIMAPSAVCDEAIREAERRIGHLLVHLPVVRRNMALQEAEVHIIGKDQATSDLPEWRHMKGQPVKDRKRKDGSPMPFDERSRGQGGIVASCGEENLLKLPSDRYKDHRDICSHEFAHGIQGHGMSDNVRAMWLEQYKRAKAQGLWPSYAGTNEHEYFAEITMWYIGSRGDYGDIVPRPRRGAAWLKRYDPEGFALAEAFYCGHLPVEPITLAILQPTGVPESSALSGATSGARSTISFDNRTNEACEAAPMERKAEVAPTICIRPHHAEMVKATAGETWRLTGVLSRKSVCIAAVAEPGLVIVRDATLGSRAVPGGHI